MIKNPSISDKDFTGVFHIKQLVIPLHLGVTPKERANLQEISIDLKLYLKALPKGMVTDDISDTICYDKICTQITSAIEKKEFKLIESVSQVVIKLLIELDCFSNIQIFINKKPKIKGLHGFVTLELSTFNNV